MPQAQQQGKPLQLPEEETLLSQTKVMTVGRQVGAYLLIDSDSISRRHAEITYANRQYMLRDLGSSNGTFVNEARLEPGKAYILKPGDKVRFGKAKFVFQVRGVGSAQGTSMQVRSQNVPGITRVHEMATGFYDPGERDKSGPSAPSGQPVLNADGSLLLPGATKALPADVVATLQEAPALIIIAHGNPRVFHLKQGKRITLGRDKASDVVLPEVAASRLHAEVFPGPDGFYIRDLGSANGVIVNQVKIDNPYLLVHGDRIVIGGIVIFFMNIRQEERVDGGRSGQESPSGQGLSGQGQALPLHYTESERGSKICRNCGASNGSIARFCVSCGTPLENSNVAIKP